jgi:hypothetical protein
VCRREKAFYFTLGREVDICGVVCPVLGQVRTGPNNTDPTLFLGCFAGLSVLDQLIADKMSRVYEEGRSLWRCLVCDKHLRDG